MDLLSRRRSLMRYVHEKAQELEHPDMYMLVFQANAGNMNPFNDNHQNISYILDGVELSTTGSTIYIPTDGIHTLYFMFNGNLDRPGNKTWLYARIPAGLQSINGGFFRSGTYELADCLSPTPYSVQPWVFTQNNGNVHQLRVPIGCSDAYKAANGWKTISNITETNDFSYTI